MRNKLPMSLTRVFLFLTEAFRQCINCRIDCTLHKVYISLQIFLKVSLGLAASIIYAQRKCLFL